MKILNNSFIRVLILLGIVLAFFELARMCGASDIRSALISMATTLGGTAIGALQHNEKADDAKQDPTLPGQPGEKSNQ